MKIATHTGIVGTRDTNVDLMLKDLWLCFELYEGDWFKGLEFHKPWRFLRLKQLPQWYLFKALKGKCLAMATRGKT